MQMSMQMSSPLSPSPSFPSWVAFHFPPFPSIRPGGIRRLTQSMNEYFQRITIHYRRGPHRRKLITRRLPLV